MKKAILFLFGGVILFVSGFFVETQHPLEEECYFVAPHRLNVREKPSLDSKIIGQVRQNTKICTKEQERGFLKTSMGFVSLEYMSKEEIPEHLSNLAPKIQQNPNPKQNLSNNAPKFSNLKPPKEEKIHLSSYPKNTNDLQKAKDYLAQKDYQKAKNLALLANKENPQDLQSWEIFARSVYLEGNPNEAILILQTILQNKPDETLFNLLETMKKGNPI
ncbi:MAG: hypothetical protein J1E31_00600 [Helicobacter sp.]|nr:hypothetical protein [Helicobacter sp.]